MRVFVAGGTGVIGRSLIPLLAAAGHEVTASTRTPGRAGLLRSLGAGRPWPTGWTGAPYSKPSPGPGPR